MEGNQYRDAAGRIVEAVGKDNILSATHCATRLRLIVKDKERIDEKKLQEIGMVKGTFFNAGQYQIILGTGIVNKVYGEMTNWERTSKRASSALCACCATSLFLSFR